MEITDGDQWGRDMGVLWAAYRMGSFNMEEGLSQEELTEYFLDLFSKYHYGWMIEDRHNGFSDQWGPVGFMLGVYNGWELEPHFEGFQWSSTRNILRAIVSFLQMIRYQKEIGVVNVHCLKQDKRFYDRVCQYGVLSYVGRIPHGDIRGDRFIYCVRGRKEAP